LITGAIFTGEEKSNMEKSLISHASPLFLNSLGFVGFYLFLLQNKPLPTHIT
jgi:hypothetical protein